MIKAERMTLVPSALDEKQVAQLFKQTPKEYIRKRPAKGGGEWEYVSVGYVQQILNALFGYDWDFETKKDIIFDSEIVVLGRLTCRVNGRTIVKEQYGNKDRIKRKDGSDLSIGNDLKSAASDALKKCASLIGVAADVYNKQEFKAYDVEVTNIDDEKEKKRVLKALIEADFNNLQELEVHAKKHGLTDLFNELKSKYNNNIK